MAELVEFEGLAPGTRARVMHGAELVAIDVWMKDGTYAGLVLSVEVARRMAMAMIVQAQYAEEPDQDDDDDDGDASDPGAEPVLSWEEQVDIEKVGVPVYDRPEVGS